MVYHIYIVFKDEGRHLTMQQCHDCDNLCSGLIEQIDDGIVVWHDIDTWDDTIIAYHYAKTLFAPEEIEEISFAQSQCEDDPIHVPIEPSPEALLVGGVLDIDTV